MRLSSTLLRHRTNCILRLLLSMAVTVTVAGASRADDNDNNADDGFYLLRFNVPATLEGKSSPGGWGALVLQFNGPAGGTGLEGATFQFLPACPNFAPGLVNPNNDLNSDFPTIQLGPGGYGLGQTGTEITSPPFAPTNAFLGQNFGTFDVIVEYELNSPGGIPLVTSAFWQSKPAPKVNGVPTPTWTFVEGEDLRLTSIPNPIFVPEPTSLVAWCLLIAASGGLIWWRRKSFPTMYCASTRRFVEQH